ncbi:hypothetical protein AB0478_32715 [Streptomyces sp. NPDC051917]|uniref:hypothetical protein n=1 Tax=Streptomyces sp. NPDC051917 TaxID=3154754 RepID=UPI00344D8423
MLPLDRRSAARLPLAAALDCFAAVAAVVSCFASFGGTYQLAVRLCDASFSGRCCRPACPPLPPIVSAAREKDDRARPSPAER